MKMSDYMQPKWFLETKRGVGMLMAGVGALVPMVGAYFGVTIDAVTWGQFAAEVAKWFEITWNVMAYALWIAGSFRPSAPITVTKPV